MRTVSLLLTFIAVITLTLAVGVIRAWPSADNSLETFLFDGCENINKPCWAGIILGETSIDEAIALLERHAWVSSLIWDQSSVSGRVEWLWNEAAPDFLRVATREEPPNLWASRGVVSYLTLPTSIPYGQFEQVLGIPPSATFQVFRNRTPRVISPPRQDLPNGNNGYFLAAYENSQYVLETHFRCPAPAKLIWDAQVRITIFSASLMQGALFDPYDLTTWVYDKPCPD